MKNPSTFLSVVIKADAIVSGTCGVGLLASGTHLTDWFGVPTSTSLPVGLFLLVWAVALLAVASRPVPNSGAVVTIITLNVLWTVGSLALVVERWLPLTAWGIGFVLFQAAAVADFALLQILGLRRRMRAPTPATA